MRVLKSLWASMKMGEKNGGGGYKMRAKLHILRAGGGKKTLSGHSGSTE